MTALKGFCTGARTEEDAQKISRLNADWWYSWGTSPNLGTPVNDFTPMIWGRGSANVETIQTIEANLWKTQSSHLLGFNEPDHLSQSEMPVEEALELWKILETTKLKLVSPATISPNAAWMDSFMEAALLKGRRIDKLAMHRYQNPDDQVFFQRVDEFYAKWKRPVWITEMAVADWQADADTPNRYGRTEVNEFMKAVASGIKARPWIERWSWKTRASTDPQMGTSALFDSRGWLTSTGATYRDLVM